MSPPKPGAIDPLLGKILVDRFEIIERIGEGGMGIVYRARQTSVDRAVAIKVLNAQVAGDPTWVQRFINEAKACSKLQHPNTIRLIDFGQSKEGLLYIAMEFLDGLSLRQALERSGAMPTTRVLKILLQACQSLAEAHALQIIHRDLKPDNLFVINLPGSPDFVKVLDFSVAKLKQQGSAAQTQAGMVFGTPQYMSPEQGRGLPLDARSDIYALGIVAYEMLTGHVPFSSANPMEVLAMHVRTPPPPMPGIPERAQQIVMHALAKDPNQRYQSVEQMANDVQAALSELSSSMQAAPRMTGAAEVKTMFVPGGAPGMGGASMGISAQQPPPPAPASEAKTMMAMPGAPMMQQIEQMRQQQLQQQQAQQQQAMAAQQAAMQAQQQAMAGQQQQMGGMQVPAHLQAQMAQAQAMSAGGGENKTMMLQSSEGVVSFAQSGRMPTPSSTPVPISSASPSAETAIAPGAGTEGGGSSALFWIVCILCGVGIGIVAYLIVAKAV